MTEHPKLNNEAVWERICRVMYSPEALEAEAAFEALIQRARAGDGPGCCPGATNRREAIQSARAGDGPDLDALADAHGLAAALKAQAAWIDGFLCGRSHERLVFADATPAQPEGHP